MLQGFMYSSVPYGWQIFLSMEAGECYLQGASNTRDYSESLCKNLIISNIDFISWERKKKNIKTKKYICCLTLYTAL